MCNYIRIIHHKFASVASEFISIGKKKTYGERKKGYSILTAVIADASLPEGMIHRSLASWSGLRASASQ